MYKMFRLLAWSAIFGELTPLCVTVKYELNPLVKER